MNKHHYMRYQRFIASRALRSIPLGTYTESHHITPRSMGGPDTAENKIILTGREHFIAHWMLFLAFKNPSMAHAYMMLHHVGGDAKRFLRKHKPRESRAYHAAKVIVAQQMGARATGMTVARNIATGELEHVTIERLSSDPNLIHHTKGRVAVRNKLTGETSMVTDDVYQMNPNLEHVSTGMNLGEENPIFQGWWITPAGEYPSKRAACSAMNLSQTAIDNRCKNNNQKPLALHALNICTDLTKEEKLKMVGRCWADFGWGFQMKDGPKMKHIPAPPKPVPGSPIKGKRAMLDPSTGIRKMYTEEEVAANPTLVHINKGRVRESGGTYITPKGRFRTKQEAMAAHGFNSNTALDNRCKTLNNKVVTAHSLQCNKDMTKEEKEAAVGKTWNEIGWGFESK